jgi:type II secretion system protein N
MNRERILSLLGYNAFFWLAFWLCAYWTFPYERLAAFITDKVMESGSGYTLEIGSLSPYWLTGVELEQVKVRKQAAESLAAPSDPKGKPELDQAIKIDVAHARLGLLALLTGSTDVSFGAELGTGEIDGIYSESGDDKHVAATLSKVDLSKLSVLESVISLPTQGTLSGEFDLNLGLQPSKTSGKVDLTIQKLTVGDGKAKFKLGSMGGLTIDPIGVGDVNLVLDVKEGTGTVKKLSSNGKDLQLQGSGDIRFAQPLTRSRLGIMLRLKLTDAYRNKTPRTKTMFALLEGSSAPQLAAARAGDGWYQLRVSGTLAAARPIPAGGMAGSGGGAATAPAMIPMPTETADDDE